MPTPRVSIDAARRRVRSLARRQAIALSARSSQTRSLAARIHTDEPSEEQLRRWAVVEGVEYQAWVHHHGFCTLHDWRTQRDAALQLDPESAPVISLLTPVWNTPPEFLRECVHSVLAQSWPYWELCIVDDASTDPETIAVLAEVTALDPRIRVARADHNRGICESTNAALAMAEGRHVAFLDHDDRLAPDALHHVMTLLAAEPELDGVYTDRDFITPHNNRTNPFFKPNWAPETLLSGNYLFHLVVYRRDLVSNLGGYRREYEGSQDLDLALRVAETGPRIAHVPRVLYHWRQHDQSMAGVPEMKAHIFEAGQAAIRDALQRRGITAEVDEIATRWRGNYRVRLTSQPTAYELVLVDDPAGYAHAVRSALDRTEAEALVVVDAAAGIEQASIDQLVAWLGQPDIAGATARVLTSANRVAHCGLVRHPDGTPRVPHRGAPADEPGHGAMNLIMRNISLLHPLACAWRTDVLRRLDGLADDLAGPHSALDASIRAERLGMRLLYVPEATVISDANSYDPAGWDAREASVFATRHAEALQYDWQYHWALDRDHPDGRIALEAPPYRNDFDPR